ncbi:unnamed protein product, partial [Phaeothamnion confervicola]
AVRLSQPATIDGIGQQAGQEFAARDARCTLSETADELSLDLAGAYPEAAGIDRWTRTLRLERGGRAGVILTDEWTLDHDPTDLRLSLMLRAEPVVADG